MWTDEKILATAVQYGEQARKWKTKFLGMLPEIERRKLYEKMGFSSTVHFAKVIGGASEDQVQTVMRVERALKSTPILHGLLVNGEVSLNKMAKIHTIATEKNEILIANQVRILSNRAVETLARDMRNLASEAAELNDKRNDIVNHVRHVPESTQEHTIELAEDVKAKLRELQSKGIDVNEELRTYLEGRERQIHKEKERIAGEEGRGAINIVRTSRYIPQQTRDILKKEYGTKCSIHSCHKQSQQIHHTRRFSISASHDPHFLAPLCREHHEIAHSVDIQVQEAKWRNMRKSLSR